jgi:oligoendopeptidase F
VRIGRKVAPLEELQLVKEGETVLKFDGHEIPLLRAAIELANSADRDFRIALDTARSREAAKALNAIRRNRFELEHEEIATLGYPDYVAAVAALSGVGLDELGASAERFLDDTRDMFRESLAQVVRKRIGVGVDQLVRSDSAWAFRANQYDAAFESHRLIETAIGQMAEMGLDAEQGGRVRFDTEEREGKQPRAFCVPVRVPEEVYLVIRPFGGHSDYRTFWHELGHAMHFSTPSRELPFAARWCGDNSVTEGFAMLWDHLTMNPAWLERYTDLGKKDVNSLVFELAVQELHLVRRYAAKLSYELSLHRGHFASAGPEYADRLSEATLFKYSEDDYLIDVDPGFYSARYLRAWQMEARLASTLTEKHGADWFRNPDSGEFVRCLTERGQATPADRLIEEVMGCELSFEPIVSRLELLLR